MATASDDERLMRRAITESRLAVEEGNAMVRSYTCNGTAFFPLPL